MPTAMVRFPDEWLGTSRRPSNFMRTQLYLRSWFERWGSVGGTPPERWERRVAAGLGEKDGNP